MVFELELLYVNLLTNRLVFLQMKLFQKWVL